MKFLKCYLLKLKRIWPFVLVCVACAIANILLVQNAVRSELKLGEALAVLEQVLPQLGLVLPALLFLEKLDGDGGELLRALDPGRFSDGRSILLTVGWFLVLMLPSYLFVQSLFPGESIIWLTFVKNALLLLLLVSMLYALMYLFRSSILALVLPAAYYLSHAMGLHFVPDWMNLYTGKSIPTIFELITPMFVCSVLTVLLFFLGEKEERQYKYK